MHGDHRSRPPRASRTLRVWVPNQNSKDPALPRSKLGPGVGICSEFVLGRDSPRSGDLAGCGPQWTVAYPIGRLVWFAVRSAFLLPAHAAGNSVRAKEPDSAGGLCFGHVAPAMCCAVRRENAFSLGQPPLPKWLMDSESFFKLAVAASE